MQQRIKWIDIAKGICMLSVIFGHMIYEYVSFVYAFHLTVFFILSGYTLKKREVNKSFLANKFSRLMIPYFFTCVCVTIMDVVNALISKNPLTTNITKIIYNNILRMFFASGTYKNFGEIEIGSMIGAIWFLPAMFFALVFAQCIINKIADWKKRFIVGCVIAMLGCATAPFLWLPFSIQASMAVVPFVLFGTWMRECELLENLQIKHYLIFAFIFLVGQLTGYAQVLFLVTCTMKDYIITPFVSICASLLVIGISKKIGHMKVLEFVGENSLIFLCVHLFEMNTLSKYVTSLCMMLGVGAGVLARTFVRLVFICVISWLIVFWKKRVFIKKTERELEPKRNLTIDILRTLLIALMLVGHRQIDGGFSKFIYSFHMMAFVLISGYFYKPVPENMFGNRCKKLIKTLLPYAMFGMLYIVVTHAGWKTEFLRVFMGISFTKKIFTNIASIGPMYFVLMLFVVKLVYMLVDYFVRKDLYKHIAVGIFTLIGVLFGEMGAWLPWSIDCALFSLMFYHVGYYMKKYNFLNFCKERPYLYFILSPIWALMIYNGSMELAMRRYSGIGLTIVGVIAAFLIVYMLCDYVSELLIKPIRVFLNNIGQSTIYILIIHTLWGNKIVAFVESVVGFSASNIYNLVVSILIQVLLGSCIFIFFEKVKFMIKVIRKKDVV